MKRRISSASFGCALLILLAACKPTVESSTQLLDPQAASPRAEASGSAPARPATALRELPDFSALVEQYGDAVVNVEVVGSAQVPTAGPGEQGEDPLSEFFRRFGIPGPEDGGPRGSAPILRGNGSGFIVTPDGYILTNAHVVSQADEVTVRLTDRREFIAKVIGSDKRTDVAVIKIDAKNLPAVRIGDPSKLRTGEWVLAIGSPFGLANSATAGIVSSTSRAVGGGSSVPFIQTDVAVNPGNSGGPLFSLDGEVVGINSMIFSQSGGYMGISFAIPIDVAMNVRDQLIKTGRVVRGRIGVGVQDVDASLARSFQLDRPRGALVSFVEPDGPAQKAGLKPGDVVLQVNGKPVEQSAELSNAVAAIKPGSEAMLKVWRSGKERDVTVQVTQLDEPETRTANARSSQKSEEGTRLGLVVRPLTPEEKQMADTEGSIVVQDVEGSAARAGLQPGDIILAVNDHSVRSVQDLRAAAKNLKGGDSAALLVERGGTQIFVPIRVS
jgi:serine protease Do